MKNRKTEIEFTCLRCGKCCEAEGYVYLKNRDIKAMAEFLEKPHAEFRKTFTEWIWWEGRVLKQDLKGCVLLVDGRCAVYEARPEQCKTWPYWKEILKDPEELEYAKTYCRGIISHKS